MRVSDALPNCWVNFASAAARKLNVHAWPSGMRCVPQKRMPHLQAKSDRSNLRLHSPWLQRFWLGSEDEPN